MTLAEALRRPMARREERGCPVDAKAPSGAGRDAVRSLREVPEDQIAGILAGGIFIEAGTEAPGDGLGA